MRHNYRGHEIEVVRDETLAGWEALFYHIIRLSDGYEVTSGTYYGAETVHEFYNIMKERLDRELEEE